MRCRSLRRLGCVLSVPGCGGRGAHGWKEVTSQKDEQQRKQPLNKSWRWCGWVKSGLLILCFFPREHIPLTPNFPHFPSHCPRWGPSGALIPSPVIASTGNWCQFRVVGIHFFRLTSNLIKGAAVLFLGLLPSLPREALSPPRGPRASAEIPSSLKLMAVRRFHFIISPTALIF